MDTSQKIGVASVFLLAWLTIAFDVIRVVETFRLGSALAALYTTLEVDVAVIISALPAYKVLLKRIPSRLGKDVSVPSKVKSPPSQGSYRLDFYVEEDSEYVVTQNFDRESRYDDPRMDPLHQNPMQHSTKTHSLV